MVPRKEPRPRAELEMAPLWPLPSPLPAAAPPQQRVQDGPRRNRCHTEAAPGDPGPGWHPCNGAQRLRKSHLQSSDTSCLTAQGNEREPIWSKQQARHIPDNSPSALNSGRALLCPVGETLGRWVPAAGLLQCRAHMGVSSPGQGWGGCCVRGSPRGSTKGETCTKPAASCFMGHCCEGCGRKGCQRPPSLKALRSSAPAQLRPAPTPLRSSRWQRKPFDGCRGSPLSPTQRETQSALPGLAPLNVVALTQLPSMDFRLLFY